LEGGREEMNTTIKIQGIEQLMQKENLPVIPPLVQKYLGMGKDHNPNGKFFQVKINQKSNPVSGHGIAYSNELILEKRTGESWKQVDSTGMLCYRGAYASDIDNWDLSFGAPAILEESVEKVTYGVRTGAGNIKIFSFVKKGQQLENFNLNNYEKTQKRIELLKQVLEDPQAAKSYIEKGLGHKWSIRDGEKVLSFKEETVKMFVAQHSDRDYDALSDEYQMIFWVKGFGIGSSPSFRTKLQHPCGAKFYYIGFEAEAELISAGSNFVTIRSKCWNARQGWTAEHEFRIEWQGGETSQFEKEFDEAMAAVIDNRQHNHPLFKPTRITECKINGKMGAFILFEQIDTDRLSEQGEGWLGDQFRYSVWKIEEGGKPVQLFEDHAYIRPRTVSKLTGTQGRDCSLTNLVIEKGKIRVKTAEGKDLIF